MLDSFKRSELIISISELGAVDDQKERYPFQEEELEILLRCYEHIKDAKSSEDFLLTLALASPFSHFFLPGDEMKDRVNWIQDHILPPGFSNMLRAAISADAFVDYANQGVDKSMERFLEGVADTGRRGAKESRRIMFQLFEDVTAYDLANVCLRLATSCDVLAFPNHDKDASLHRLESLDQVAQVLADSLAGGCPDPLTFQSFNDWVEEYAPLFSAPLSTFVQLLLFHGRPFPEGHLFYSHALIVDASDIFYKAELTSMLLCMMSSRFQGKWHRLYSSNDDGLSFNRLEWSLLGYTGPSLVAIKTSAGVVLGGFSTSPWKDSKHFAGSSDSFLFQLTPQFRVHRTRPYGEPNYIYLHSRQHHGSLDVDEGSLQAHGLGFGGTLSQPRLFIPETLEVCNAHFLDNTFKPGELVPPEEMEKFEIHVLEVWGVGGDKLIESALKDRASYRERLEDTLVKSRLVTNKLAFAEDLKSGLIPGHLFAHDVQVRGRQEFRVDEVHGGYTIDH